MEKLHFLYLILTNIIKIVWRATKETFCQFIEKKKQQQKQQQQK